MFKFALTCVGLTHISAKRTADHHAIKDDTLKTSYYDYQRPQPGDPVARIAPADAVLITAVYQKFARMALSNRAQNQLTNVIKEKAQREMMRKANGGSASARATFTMKFTIQPVTNYGCNCRERGQAHLAYKNFFMDSVDLACKKYVSSLKCLQLFYPNQDLVGENIDGMVQYIFDMELNPPWNLVCMYDFIMMQQGDKERADARFDLCVLELNAFSDQQGLLLNRAEYPNRQLNPDYILGTFIPEDECTERDTGDRPPTSSLSEMVLGFYINEPAEEPDTHDDIIDPFMLEPDMCCGGVPYFVPYNSDFHSCCFNPTQMPIRPGVLFDHFTHVCCVDGSIDSMEGACSGPYLGGIYDLMGLEDNTVSDEGGFGLLEDTEWGDGGQGDNIVITDEDGNEVTSPDQD